jgi:cytochrome P450
VIEEALRLHAPVPNAFRTAKSEVEVGGVQIPAGSTVVVSYMAGNYDPEKFDQPDRLDIDRKSLRQHLSFGQGLHYCVGHVLAKTEIRIAVEHLLSRLPNLRLSQEHPAPKYVGHAFVYALDSLHLEFEVA